MAKKVKFGFKNVYYAAITDDGYETPKKLNGAVSMSLSKVGENVDMYADDVSYFRESVNNGYDGTLEVAKISQDFLTDILGYTVDTNGIIVENANAVSKNFALLCEFTTDDGAEKYAFLNCSASRPDISSTTKTSTKEVQTESLEISIRPNADGIVRYTTGDDPDETVAAGWYSAVYQGSASI